MRSFIEDIAFELSMKDEDSNFDYENIQLVKKFVKCAEEDYKELLDENKDALKTIKELKAEIEAHVSKKSSLSKEDLKEVYLMLKERKLHPAGWFDKAKRFYLDDGELVNVRQPSASYPYTQMNAGRTSKFVRDIADKYNCQTKEELIARFKSS